MSQADIMTAVPPPDAAGKVPPKERALNMFRILMGNCFCEPLMPFDVAAASTQFVELHGILFIGLGAMSDELRWNSSGLGRNAWCPLDIWWKTTKPR